MAKLVELVPGGYKVEDSSKVIPAADLVPFGAPEDDFLTYAFYLRNKHLYEGYKDPSQGDMVARRYAEQFEADFYEIRERDERDMLQLYVRNNPSEEWAGIVRPLASS